MPLTADELIAFNLPRDVTTSKCMLSGGARAIKEPGARFSKNLRKNLKFSV